MNNKYFALRHGQSKPNVLGIVLSSLDDGKKEEYTLTKEGEKQVEFSVKKAKESEVLGSDTIIYSSPFSRTKRTAEIAKEVLGVNSDIIFDERLRERWFGDWEKTDHSAYKKVWADDEKDPEHKEKNVESTKEVLDRTMALVKDSEGKYKNKNILLVSHGDAIKIMETGFKKISPGLHKGLSIHTAEIRELK
jgi:probable phosphoglycerate mutase